MRPIDADLVQRLLDEAMAEGSPWEECIREVKGLIDDVAAWESGRKEREERDGKGRAGEG